MKKVIINGECPIDFSEIPALKRKKIGVPHQGQRKRKVPVVPVSKNDDLPNEVHEPSLNAASQAATEPATENCSSEISFELHGVEAYLEQLLLFKGITPVGSSYKYFVLKDYNMHFRRLEQRKFVIVSRAARQFKEVANWSYACSCDLKQSNLVEGLSLTLNVDYKSFREEYHTCLHIKTLSEVLQMFDEHEGIVPTVFDDHSYASLSTSKHQGKPLHEPGVYETSWDVETFVVVDENASIGIISLSNGSLHCNICRGKVHCKHLTNLSKLLKDPNMDLPKSLRVVKIEKLPSCSDTSKTTLLKCLSYKEITYQFSALLGIILSEDAKERLLHAGEAQNGIVCLIPSAVGQCDQCGHDFADTPALVVNTPVPLIDKKRVHQVNVYSRLCSNEKCTGVLHYDGQEHCFLNMKHCIVTYEVFVEFMDLFTRNRTTMFTYYAALCEIHNRCQSHLENVFSYEYFKLSWYAFLDLMYKSIDLKEGFQCCECGSNPDQLIMDATSMACKRPISKWNLFMEEQSAQKVKPKPVPKGQKTFIKSDKTKFLLKCYSGWSQGHALVEDDFLALTSALSSEAPSLLPLFRMFSQDGFTNHCPPEYRDLLRSLAAKSPVCALVHPTHRTLTLMNKISMGEELKDDPKQMEALQEEVPVFFHLLKSVEHTPPQLRPLAQALCEISLKPFEAVEDQRENLNMSQEVMKERNSFFPCLPLVRGRGTYAADKDSSRRDCVKKTKGHPSLLPGIFCLFCKHSICYGFHLMECHESPNVPFTVLFTRFKRAPSVIVYDNACNLHKYALRREPGYFKWTWFLVDRLHWHNHTSCSEGYRLDSYTQFRNLNSQAAEQWNSSIRHLKSMLSYMTHEHFMQHCSFFLWALNQRKMNSM